MLVLATDEPKVGERRRGGHKGGLGGGKNTKSLGEDQEQYLPARGEKEKLYQRNSEGPPKGWGVERVNEGKRNQRDGHPSGGLHGAPPTLWEGGVGRGGVTSMDHSS